MEYQTGKVYGKAVVLSGSGERMEIMAGKGVQSVGYLVRGGENGNKGLLDGK